MRARVGRTPPGRVVWIVLAAGVLAATVAHAQVRITGLEATRDDSLLSCTIATSGLPDAASLETLASGLPSSLTMSIALLDASGHERGGSTCEIRIEPDPWERGFRVSGPAFARRAGDLEALRAVLQRIGPLPIARLARLDPRTPPRLRVRLAIHALAPAEVERAHALFSGDMAGNGADRREVSTGVGTLLRFFLGPASSARWSVEAVSAPLDPRTLPRTP